MIDEPLDPQRPDEAGKAPKNRFASHAGLWSEFQRAQEAHMRNDVRFTALRGIFDRLPPENPAWLEAQGLEDMPNFNLGEFTSKVESYVSTWVDHNTGGYKFYDIKLHRKNENPPELSDYYDEKVTEFFNEAITEWDDDSDTQSAAPYILESCVRDLQMGIFGIGLPYFNDDTDWRFNAIPTRKVFVPRGTKITLRNCSVLFILTETTVTEIYNTVQSAGVDSGWNKKAVYDMLYNKTAEEKGNGTLEQFSDWENRRRNNDTFLHSNFAPVELVDCYVQEFTTERQKDGISHYVISRSGTPLENLFEKDRQYESFRSFLIPFSDNAGPEGDWHGVKGFGDAIYDNCHFQNQFFNHMARSAIIANMPMFNANNEADREKLAQFKWTFLGIMNPGLTLQQTNVRTDLNGMMGVFSASQRTVNTNSRTYPTGESLGQEAKTATQSTFDRQDQAKLSSLQIKMYRMIGLDSLGAEMYRRLTKSGYPKNVPGGRAAASFRKKCEEAGIPKDCYQKPKMVQADRTGGTGNQALDVMVGEKLLGIATPGRGQLNARRTIAKSLVGSDRVEEFVQGEDAVSPVQGDINVENSCLADGQTFEAVENQEHLIHLGALDPNGKGHLAVLLVAYQQAAEMAKAGAIENALPDAQKLSRTLEAILTHVASHVGFLSQFQIPMYQEMAKEFNKTVNDVAQFLQTFNQQIGSAMEQQQAQAPQMTPEMAKMMAETQFKLKMREAEAMQDMELNKVKTFDKIQNLNQRTEVNNALKARSKQVDLELKQAQADQDMGIKASDALVEQQIALAQTRAKANAETVTTE